MILDLGVIDYEEAYRVQRESVKRRKLGEIEDSVILAEHKPVFTIGRIGKAENLLVDDRALAEHGIKVLRVDRGGDITFHGPGQLILYPIIDLKERGKDLHRYLRGLEDVVIKYLQGYSIRAERIYGKTGVWVNGKKIASMGIAASGWITYHGLSINLNVDLDFFSMINPCGMKDIEVTSLANILNKNVPMNEAKWKILVQFNDIFNLGGSEFASSRCATLA